MILSRPVLSRTPFLMLFFAIALCFSAGTCLAKPPNIVFVLTDDQAPWAMGAAVSGGQYGGVPHAVTPNMDRLAREGMTFTNFFCTTPVCSPSRASLATGRYASEWGIDDFIPMPGHVLFDSQHQVALDPVAATTFAEVLQSAGYHTGLIGKWHLGDWTFSGNERFHPTNHGFDYFMGLYSGGTSPSDPVMEKDGKEQHFKGLTTDILTDHAIKFIEESQQQLDPFLLCFHTRAPHGRWLPVAPEDWEPYEEMDPTIPNPDYPDLDIKRVKRDMREYLASTSGVDRNLGRLLDKLDELDIANDTIVIFTSDHGYNMGHNGIVHKGNGIWATRTKPPGEMHHGTRVISNKYRPNLYDLSLKVPAIIRWPGVTQGGAVTDNTVTSLDLYPTLLSMANVQPPDGLVLRGRDLTSMLAGQPIGEWDQDYFGQYSMIHYAVATMRCYRTPRYKLVRDFHNTGRDEFFDLKSDPNESINLINDSDPKVQQVIEQLQRKLLARMEEIDDPVLNHPAP